MAAVGFTPISLYYSATALAVPTAGNLVPGELALNTADGKLYYKSLAGVVTLLAGATAGPAGGSNTQIQFNSSNALAGSANLTWSGTVLAVTGGLTATRSGSTVAVFTQTSATGYGMTIVPGADTVYEAFVINNAANTLNQIKMYGNGSASFASGVTIQGLTVGLGAGAVATNTAVGYQAAFSNVSGSNNSYLGYQSGYYQTGSRNTGLGFGALVGTAAVSNTGIDSTAIGSSALAQNYSGSYNTGVGSQALKANTTASYNTAVGFSALVTNIVGTENSAFGVYALRLNNNGNYNSAFGLQALEANVSGNSNTAAGYQALVNNAGSSNTAVGYRAAYTVTGGNNTAIGNNAGSNGTTGTSAGDYNTSVGDTALNSISTGGYNTAVGGRSLYRVSSGNYNVAMGYQAGNTIATATAGTFIGTFAGLYATGADNTAVGYAALSANTNPSAGAYNTAIGSQALIANVAGPYNTAVGYQAAFGYSGANGVNTIIGAQAMYSATSSLGNYANVIVGFQAGYNLNGTTAQGIYNTFVGTGSGAQMTTGSKNTILGCYNGNTVGVLDIRTSDNYIVLSDGDGNVRGIFDNNGTLLVGKTSAATTSLEGTVVTKVGRINVVTAASTSAFSTYELYSTGAGAYRFYVDAAGTISATSIVITAISDERLKENVRDIDTGLSSIMALKPRRFDWKEGKGQDKKNAAGFIAQEFENVFPECVGTSKAGEDGIEYKNINHETLIPTLVKAIQEQQALITTLTARITALEGA